MLRFRFPRLRDGAVPSAPGYRRFITSLRAGPGTAKPDLSATVSQQQNGAPEPQPGARGPPPGRRLQQPPQPRAVACRPPSASREPAPPTALRLGSTCSVFTHVTPPRPPPLGPAPGPALPRPRERGWNLAAARRLGAGVPERGLAPPRRPPWRLSGPLPVQASRARAKRGGEPGLRSGAGAPRGAPRGRGGAGAVMGGAVGRAVPAPAPRRAGGGADRGRGRCRVPPDGRGRDPRAGGACVAVC